MSWTIKVPASSTDELNIEEARRFLEAIADPKRAIQLQYLPAHAESYVTIPGSFLECQTDWIVRQSANGATGFLAVCNPVPIVLTRKALIGDICYRRWIALKVNRSGVHEDNATESELATVGAVVREVRDHLHQLCWPEPLSIKSGNGWILLYRVSLKNTSERRDTSQQLVKGFLSALADRFDTDEVTLDQDASATVSVRIPGTWCVRNLNTPDRPRRMVRLEPLSPASSETLIQRAMRSFSLDVAPLSE